MASDSPARSLDEIDLSALRVSGEIECSKMFWLTMGKICSASRH